MPLFLVATPIGNLSDLTPRALETLRSVDFILAEDTRRTRALCTHFGFSRELVAYHRHSSPEERDRIVARLVAGAAAACVSDAGTPGVADPGDDLAQAAVAAGVTVTPIPGPSAVLAALAGSALGIGAAFRFLGFPPREGPARAAFVGTVAGTPEPVVLFESPNRVEETLKDLAFAMPTRRACVARELTKVHEEFVRGTLEALAAPREWLGECVIVLAPRETDETNDNPTDDVVDARIDAGLREGLHAKTLAERIAAWSGRPKRDVYERVVTRKNQRP